MKKLFIATCLGCISFSALWAQNLPLDHDTSYYVTYRSKLTGRAYLSRKYNVLSFDPPPPGQDFQYRATTSLNLGIGATYHAFTLNIGIGITKFNPDKEKGDTRYLDLQGHFYARKWNIDLLGSFYKGFYLTPAGLAAPPGEPYYVRPDIGLSLVGLAFYRQLNQDKFSYQAALLQNEWQKKSAGSILFGGEIYYGAIFGDSSLAPTLLDPKISQLDVNKYHFVSFGPGLGYGYTFVYKERLFLMLSATINLAFRYSNEISSSSGEQESLFGFRPNYLFHAALGYNGPKWCLSLQWVDTELFLRGAQTLYEYTASTGNYRLIYARRFSLDRNTKKLLKPIPDILGQ
jgi:hypothetical protein